MPQLDLVEANTVATLTDRALTASSLEAALSRWRAVFVERLDFQAAIGTLRLTSPGLPATATRVAERDGVQVVAQALPDDRRVTAVEIRAALKDIRATLNGDLLLLVTNTTLSEWHMVYPAPAAGREALRRLILRPGEPHRTAISQLTGVYESLQRGVDIRTALERAFDVKAVTKEFYERYKQVFNEVEQAITGFSAADAERKRLFTQRLFNRLMFVAFIEKKGWLSFGGDTDYLNALWKDYQRHRTADSNFYRERLDPLFFAGLNSAHEVDIINNNGPNVLQQIVGKVPYLNGGLFDRDSDGDDNREEVLIPDACFAAVLDELFNRFNFTVTESTPWDVVVAVDPEMLGKVFERMVTGCHESGSYYTPKEIVSFMCREALKGYLETATPGEPAAAIARFVDKTEPDDLHDREAVLDALRQVTVCDPACGSGAYLLGMLQELFELRRRLFELQRLDNRTAYDRKLEIIANNVYGVDIDEFAVNIARLRLWLSLVVEYDGPTPPPLPNLTFKIERGDSLTAPDPSAGANIGFVKVEVDRYLALKRRYLKALYELHRQELEVPELEPGRRGAPDLANFQLDAVRRGLAMVRQHGGCFIGDVVGLGKTYIGAELVRQLQYEEPRGSHPVIVCPAGLQPMWRRINEAFGLGAAIVSMTSLTPPNRTEFDEDQSAYVEATAAGRGVDLLQQYPNRGVVLVDEVHNFRNPNTGRYRALAHYLAGGEHKTVLLSATPQNLGPADIYHQLRLFLDDLDHKLDLEPLHLEEYFRAVQQWYEFQIESDNYVTDLRHWQESVGKRGVKRQPPPVAPQPPSTPRATIEEVLRPVFVRRRRKDITELYGSGIEISGRPVRFPEPVLDNLFYRLDKVYARAGKFADLQARLQQHRGARYLALDYLRSAAREKGEYRDLLRARNRVAALMRALLFKRLESSVAAFRATLDTLARSNRHFRAALDGGVVPIGRTATSLLAGETFDLHELLERLEQEEQRRQAANASRARMIHPVEDFDIGRWQVDLDADYAILERLRADVAAITPDDDDKLRALQQFLARPEVAAGRVLIFSEAAATVEYLFEQLNPGADDLAIARLSGAHVAQVQQVVKRFAPAANLADGDQMPGPPVRVLITTDVVSEGQNLQDCNRVLNYDLHWNPVRLIQRFGRVDRIGTTYERIFLHNTWPDTDVDAGLSLTERLQRRIQSFHDFIGLDTPLLSADERLNPNAMYRIYEQKQLPERDDVLDEVAAFQRGVALLQRIQQDDPELWKVVTALPDGIRAALPARAAPEPRSIVDYQVALPGLELQQPLMTLETAPAPALPPSPLDAPRPGETVAIFKHGERPAAYAVGSDRNARAVSSGQLLAAVECAPETPAAPLPPDTNARVMAAYEAMRQDSTERLGRSRRPSGDSRLRRYLSRELRAARTLERDEDDLRRIGILQQIFLDYLPATVVTDLEDVRRLDLRGDALIRRLEAVRERHRLQPALEEGNSASSAIEVIRIVCSEGLAE